jgi:nucleotide-binding universal stress UspA family protein
MRVLVTLDGSELAERSLSALARWLPAWSAEVMLLRVIDPGDVHSTPGTVGHPVLLPSGVDTGQALRGMPVQPLPPLVEDRGQAMQAALTAATEELQDAAARHLAGWPTTVHVKLSDDPARAIAEFAAENGIDFVAISTHGRSGLSQLLMGSVAASVVRRVHVPVIVVGAGTAASN